MSGRSFTLYCLKKTHAKVKPLDVVLLYGQNEIPFLREVIIWQMMELFLDLTSCYLLINCSSPYLNVCIMVIYIFVSYPLIVLWQMQSHVDVKKLAPPSFQGLSMMTEALPSLSEEEDSMVCHCCKDIHVHVHLYYFPGERYLWE